MALRGHILLFSTAVIDIYHVLTDVHPYDELHARRQFLGYKT